MGALSPAHPGPRVGRLRRIIFEAGHFLVPGVDTAVVCAVQVGWIWVIGVTVFGWVTRSWAYFVKFLSNNLCAILPCLVSRGKVW